MKDEEEKIENVEEKLLHMTFDNYLKHIGGVLKREKKKGIDLDEELKELKKEKNRLRQILDELTNANQEKEEE